MNQLRGQGIGTPGAYVGALVVSDQRKRQQLSGGS